MFMIKNIAEFNLTYQNEKCWKSEKNNKNDDDDDD